jgi:hypothetical protein
MKKIVTVLFLVLLGGITVGAMVGVILTQHRTQNITVGDVNTNYDMLIVDTVSEQLGRLVYQDRLEVDDNVHTLTNVYSVYLSDIAELEGIYTLDIRVSGDDIIIVDYTQITLSTTPQEVTLTYALNPNKVQTENTTLEFTFTFEALKNGESVGEVVEEPVIVSYEDGYVFTNYVWTNYTVPTNQVITYNSTQTFHFGLTGATNHAQGIRLVGSSLGQMKFTNTITSLRVNGTALNNTDIFIQVGSGEIYRQTIATDEVFDFVIDLIGYEGQEIRIKVDIGGELVISELEWNYGG